MPLPSLGAQRASYRARSIRSLIRALVVGTVAVTILAPVAQADITAAPTPRSIVVRGTPVAAASAPWLSVEQYYLTLVNCTRTGGWVLSSGKCDRYGSGHYSAYVKPLALSAGISNSVARPYAKSIVTANKCLHDYGGGPGDRFRRAGYSPRAWGENIGCASGYASAKTAVLKFHLMFQNEKPSNGGHWKNIKNASYSQIGIGVWMYGGRTRLVTDFYKP